MPSLTRAEVNDWLDSDVTKRYFKVLKEEADARRIAAGMGSLKKETAYETGENYLKVIAQAEVYEACAAPIEVELKSKGGIILATDDKKKFEQQAQVKAKILAIGELAFEDQLRSGLDCPIKVGDIEIGR